MKKGRQCIIKLFCLSRSENSVNQGFEIEIKGLKPVLVYYPGDPKQLQYGNFNMQNCASCLVFGVLKKSMNWMSPNLVFGIDSFAMSQCFNYTLVQTRQAHKMLSLFRIC